MIDWSKYFDKIYCLNFIQYTKRKQMMDFQLNRIGILNSGIFQYHFSDNANEKFDVWLKRNIVSKYVKYISYHYVDIALNHYYVIRDAYFRGYKHILILEDDMRFLKGIDKIEQILQHKPEDANIILYDKFIEFYKDRTQFKSVNDYYDTFNRCWSAGCYALDRKGMETLINLMENVQLRNPDNFFFDTKRYLPDLKCYCSKTNVAIQCQFCKSQTYYYKQLYKKANNIIHKGYKYLNINYDNYVVRIDDKPYYYGDYIAQSEELTELPITYEENKQMMKLNDPIQPTQMNICLATTLNHIDKMLPIVYSLQKYSESKFNVYIIVDGDTEKYLQMFKPFINDKMNIQLVSSKIIDDNINPSYGKRLTNLTYAKLVIPTLFPDLDRMLYIDYDAIIVNKGLEWFYNIDFRDNYVACSEDRIVYNYLEGWHGGFFGWEEGDVFRDSKLYFNAGIMLFNLKKIRQNGKDKEMMEVLKTPKPFQRVILEDQSLLNHIFKNTALRVNPIFNSFCPQVTHCFNNIQWKKHFKQMFNIDNKRQFFDNVIICHFACNRKPWSFDPKDQLDEDKEKTFQKYKMLYNETLEKINEYYLV